MAERIVSPGVFTNEIDQSFLPAAISELGAALVGICNKGPAFVPTQVESFEDFKIKFGDVDPDLFMPYAAKSYLKNSGRATIVRVLGRAGYTAANAILLTDATEAAATAYGTYHIVSGSGGIPWDGEEFKVSDGTTTYQFTAVNSTSPPDDVSGSAHQYYFSTDVVSVGSATTEFVNTGYASMVGNTGNNTSMIADSNLYEAKVVQNLASKINSVLGSSGTSAQLFSSVTTGSILSVTSSHQINSHNARGQLLQMSASQAGISANNITFTSGSGGRNAKLMTLQGSGGTSVSASAALTGGVDAAGGSVLAAVFPQRDSSWTEYPSFGSATITGTAQVNDFTITWDGGSTVSPKLSLKPSSDNYIVDILGSKPNTSYDADKPGYVETIFPYHIANEVSSTATVALVNQSQAYGVAGDGYSAPSTPYITGPHGGETIQNLFKLTLIADGTAANQDVKVGILNIKHPDEVPGTGGEADYGQFDLIVRKYDDTDKRPVILESFAGCSMDPDSTNYFARKIGDQYWKFDQTQKKVLIYGDYPQKSKYIRVSDINSKITNGAMGKEIAPFGFQGYAYPVGYSGGSQVSMSFQTNQTGSDVVYNQKIYHGVAFDSASKEDLKPYHGPYEENTYINGQKFALDTSVKTLGGSADNLSLSTSALEHKKFILGFQGGFDGFDPRYDGGSFHGFGKAQPANTNTVSDADIESFKLAIDTISNPDEIDINMLVVPGVTIQNHGKVYTHARDAVENRADTFLVVDAAGYDASVADATSAVASQDSNYSAAYYPWVRILDEVTQKQRWVPPSVTVPGVIAYTDKVAHPWYAPAGLNRGGLNEVVMARTRLTHDERDTLYEARVNPIATFPGQGICVWGQKTLQAKPSALDRVNVRRLLIAVKKFIASTSRFLVFEQNNSALRNRFLNIVNPYLEQVQSNNGLNAFRVVMDETNNTPETIDRNQLMGQLFLQPTRTAEFIVLDFVVQSTGASFPE